MFLINKSGLNHSAVKLTLIIFYGAEKVNILGHIKLVDNTKAVLTWLNVEIIETFQL